MSRGVDELVSVLDEIKKNAIENKSSIDDDTFGAIAMALKTIYKFKVPRCFSREQAAHMLGVSVRQLSRIVKKRGIKPHRDGFKNVYFTESDIAKMI